MILVFIGLLSLSQPSAPANHEPVQQQNVQQADEPFEAFSESVLADMETRYLASKRLSNELQYRINRNFQGEGYIYIGKIIKPANAEISALVTVEQDGSFASAVAPNRKLIFYAHGYHPIIVDPVNRVEGPLYDAGELVFEPLKPKLQPSLTSIVVTRDTQFEQEIKARLIIEHRDFLGQDGGTWQARYRPIVEEKRLRHGERVTFNGLGLNPYRLELWSEGYVVEVIDVRPNQADAIDLDARVITPAKTFRFRYIGNFNVTDQDNWPAFKTEAIMANGKRQFVFHEERHPKGYLQRSRMRLTPNGQEVEILYPVIPTEYYDLGAVDIADIRAEDLLPEALDAKKISRPIFLQSGRTYFMQNKRREVNALFEVKEIMEGSQQKPL